MRGLCYGLAARRGRQANGLGRLRGSGRRRQEFNQAMPLGTNDCTITTGRSRLHDDDTLDRIPRRRTRLAHSRSGRSESPVLAAGSEGCGSRSGRTLPPGRPAGRIRTGGSPGCRKLSGVRPAGLGSPHPLRQSPRPAIAASLAARRGVELAGRIHRRPGGRPPGQAEPRIAA